MAYLKLFLLLLFVYVSSTYKIIIFVPTLSNSQVVFNCRIGDLLAEAGHDVTLYRPQLNPNAVKIKAKKAKELRVPSVDPARFLRMQQQQHSVVFTDANMLFQRKMVDEFLNMFADSCRAQITNTQLISDLQSAKFDLAISHMYDMCPLGMIHLLKIPTYIWMSSGIFMENMAWASGTPSPPSYVPNIMSALSDRMTYFERTKNFIGGLMFTTLAPMFTWRTTALFREQFGEDFPAVTEIAAKSPLLFINSEELLDFPRPILHKTIYIGGIGMKEAAPLKNEWQQLMDNSQDGVILMSFGSVANSSSMPLEWKREFLKSFANFPTYTIVWKYEIDDISKGLIPESKNLRNLHLSTWVPQKDMLGHSKMRAFITHGGYNSMLESAHAGVPLVTLPLFGDQFRNSRAARRHGFAVGFDKSDVNEKTITKALNTLLNDNKYADNAKRLSGMLRKKPIKSEKLVVKWVEFLAEFKELPNLEVAANDLNLIQYFCLDVIGGIVGVLVIGIYLLYTLLKWYYWLCCSVAYEKKKKQ